MPRGTKVPAEIAAVCEANVDVALIEKHWDMCRVAFTADINNHASIRALESIGATQEGVLRSDMVLASGVRRNTAVFGILQHEWRTHIKAMLAEKIAAGNLAETAPAPGLWQKIRRFLHKP